MDKKLIKILTTLLSVIITITAQANIIITGRDLNKENGQGSWSYQCNLSEPNYKTEATWNVMGFHSVSYGLTPCKLERTKIEIIPNTPTRLCSEINKTAKDRKPTLNGMKIIGKGKDRRYVWDLKRFSSKKDFSLCLQTGRNYIRYRVVYPLLQDDLSRLHAMTKDQLAWIRNTIYAQYGRVFEEAKLQGYFKHQWWYEPNLNYSDTLLTREDQTLLLAIKQVEAKKTS